MEKYGIMCLLSRRGGRVRPATEPFYLLARLGINGSVPNEGARGIVPCGVQRTSYP